MIYVECSPDAALVQRVTRLRRREIIHELRGKYEGCKRISASRDSIGVVDEDPNSIQPIYLKTLRVLEDLPPRGLRVFHDDSRHNRIVVLRPKLEDWILTAASDAGLDMARYGLPATSSALHRQINVDPRKLERLLQGLNDAESERLQTLARFLAPS